MRRVLELALLLGLTLAAAPTWPAKPNAKAQADFKRGAALYRQGDYEKALEAFRASLEKERRPSTILNLAQCHRQLKRAKQALEHYQLYLAEFARQHPGEAIPHEDEVKEHITKLAAEVEPKEPPGPPTQGTLSVRSEPAGAELLLDGKPVGQAPYSGTVGPGRHRVSARLAGHAEASQEVEVVSGQSAEVTVRLAPAAAPAPPPRRRVWAWVTGTTALVAAGIGIGLGVAAKSGYDEFQTTPSPTRYDELKDSVPRLGNASTAMFVVGGALAVTSVVLFFVEGRRPAEAPASRAGLRLEPLAGSVWGLSLGSGF